MKLQIIKDDNLVTIEGVSKKIDVSALSNIHAVTFDSTLNSGFIEYTNSIPANKIITDIDIATDFQVYIDKWSNNEVITDNTPVVPPYVPTLEEVKISKNTAINASRDIEIDKGFTFNSIVFDSDATARANVTAQLTAITSGLVSGSLSWRAKNNTNISMTAQEFTYLAGTMISYVESQYQKSWLLKDQVGAASTKEEVEAILWV